MNVIEVAETESHCEITIQKQMEEGKSATKAAKTQGVGGDAVGQGHKRMSFGRRFIRHDSSDQVTSLKLDYKKRKCLFFHARMKTRQMAVTGHAKLG